MINNQNGNYVNTNVFNSQDEKHDKWTHAVHFNSA